ncbi:MAG TPA: hypothetical protein VMD92_07480 [Acidobacteriaceae bacterium]|jgi:hypothetical protein|nr:hypothetical protein [Acidobacteriaceae bacterium]
MAHQIAFNRCFATPLQGYDYVVGPPLPSPVALFLTWLDANGEPSVFQQTTDGVWLPSQPLTAPGGTGLASIVGVGNYLVALGQDQQLYAAYFSQAGDTPNVFGWSAFQPIFPTLFEYAQGGDIVNPPVNFDDFSATLAWFDGVVSLVIVASAKSVSQTPVGPGDAGFFAYTVNLTATAGFTVNSGSWASVSQSSQGGVQSGQCPALAQTPNLQSIALLGTDAGVLAGWSTSNGSDWLAANTADELLIGPGIDQIVLTQGASTQPLQAVILVFGKPLLCWDSSGNGSIWSYYGPLLPANTINPPTWTTAAAGTGNAGNLQVVGIGPTVYPQPLPWLVWQSPAGAWSPFPYDPNTGEYVDLASGFGPLGNGTYPADLAIGTGWSGNAPALQVGYLGQDGNIYITWQDSGGTWHWYPGLQGHGLP